MLPFKKILCHVDFSESSIDALKAANELSVHFSSELIVVHVIPPMTVPVAPEDIPPPLLDVFQYERSLRDHYGRLLPEVVSRNLSKQVRVQSFILHGDVAHEIARVSKENDADLIVVAPHSHSGLRRFIFGSLAQKITRLAPCPVMTLVSRDQEAVSIGAEGSGEKKPG